MNKIDIIVPVLNEAENLTELITRIGSSMNKAHEGYRIIVVDDHSTDDTTKVLGRLAKKYPITRILKQGKRGKAYSILEGAKKSDADYVVMIDGDLQYAPEYIPQMLKAAKKEDYGVVIGNRVKHNEGAIRKFVSKVGHFIYAKMLLGIASDTQSGLKLFKRSIVEHLGVGDVKPWAFDLPLIYTARELGESIGSVDIDFAERKKGKSKINLVRGTFEILLTALGLKLKPKKVFHIAPKDTDSMVGAGLIYKKKKFITHTTLHPAKSAVITFTRMQLAFISFLFVALIAGLILNTLDAEITFIAILSAIYFADVFFSLYLVLKSLHFPPEIHFAQARLDRLKDEYLPVYSILCPLYKEAHILPQFVKNIEKLDWPKDKLDVLLLLEEDDAETIKAAKSINLPDYFRILVVPDSLPKTKPKACNYGLNHAKGEFVVIYDAEDMPEPEQLKKAFLGFSDSQMDVFCLQAKLNYYNPNQNLLTRLFTAEYSLWFDVVLPGLQTIGTTIPLGGTSNHFRTAELKKLQGWDPFNVAEDADLGARLFRAGYKTAIIDSVTLEEANSSIKNWIRQRSRWLKGYIQTYLVQMRTPISFAREKKVHYLIFQLVSGLRITFMLINPFLWAMTLAYFLLYQFVGPQIEALYPSGVFYMALFSAIFGNFLYVYYYMIGAAKRGEWGIIKYVFLVPFYWVLTSIGAFMAFYQLIFKPHFWEKTIHGLVKIDKKEKKKLINIEFGILKNFGLPHFNGVKDFLKSDYFAGVFLIGASMVGNVLNFLYNAYLGRKLDLEDFGLIGLVGSFTYITSIPLSALGRTVTYRTGYLFGKYKTPIKDYWAKIRGQSIKFSAALALLWLVLTPFLASVFKSDTYLPFIIFVPVWIMGFAAAVDSGFLGGNLFFIMIGVASIAEAFTKLLFSVFFVQTGHHEWVYVAIPLSMSISFIVGWLFITKLKSKKVEIDTSLTKFPKKFFLSSAANKISTIAFLSLDLVLAKIFLSPEDAGRYAILSLAGKMVYLIGSQFSGFIIPIVSKNEGEGVASENSFYKLLGVTAGSSFLAYITFGPFGQLTAPFLFGSKAYGVIQFLPLYAFAIFMQTIATSIVTFHQVKGRHIFPYLGFLFSLIQVAVMIFFHRGISDIVWAMALGGLFYLSGMVLLHLYYEQFKSIVRNLRDLAGLFIPTTTIKLSGDKAKLNILIFNWRDTRHVWSGGAEVYIQEIAQRLVAKGHKVTVFCGNDTKSPRNEKINGVQMVRRGGFYTVYLWAFLYYMLKFRGYFDVIIDSENGIPFFTPLYAKEKVFLLIHHIHQDLFRIKLKPPLSWLGKYLEKNVMPAVYKDTEVITVSPSSKADILEHKITTREPFVVYNGVDTNIYKPGIKAKNPTILYLGRLTPQKSLSVLIKSAKTIIAKIPKVEIVIAGDGVDRGNLMRLTKKLGLQDKIKFLGKVTEEEKLNLYQKAWVFVNPSLIEGWGITTIEANACGTPVVASNVSGLRDAVHNPHSGLLVPYGNTEEFAKSIVSILRNKEVRNKMSMESIEWAKKFEWETSTNKLLELC